MTVNDAKKDADKLRNAVTQIDNERILRIIKGLAKYEEYFSTEGTSLTADKLQGMLYFLSRDAPGAKIQRLGLYSFNQFFRPDGEVRIAKELERVRKLMLDRAKKIHSRYDSDVEKEISSLQEELKGAKIAEKRSIEFQIKQLQKFLDLPGNLEIKNAAIDEISARLKARNIKAISELNRPPDGGIFRIALRDCTIAGYMGNKEIRISVGPFNPTHLLTYAMNANLLNENAPQQAKEWWNFTVDVLGYKGARTFYEMCGYLMITRHPLPTERTILIIIGDPGSGKGTHLAATQEMLTYDQIRLFAKADPHKLTDPREHFSRQSLQGKLALISGDLKHTKIRDFSEVNDLFGGEPQEIEKKFRDPTTEDPIFKAIWATTPPLFKVDQAGGAWRRAILLSTRPVANKDRDNDLKPEMLSQMDGFFLNALIGLSYLSTGGWRFTGELTDAELEELWTFHSDSVQVWARNMSPEPATIENEIEIASTLDGKKTAHVPKENTDAMHIVDDLYAEYADWCARKEIEPVKPKTFSAWLGNHGYVLKKKSIEEGRFKGERKIVTFASWIDDGGSDEDLKMDRTGGNISWEAYFSNAPLTLDNVSDSHGQPTRNEKEKKENDNFHDHGVTCVELPSWIGHMVRQSLETANIGFPRDSDPCPIRFEKQEVEDSFKNKNDPETLANPSKFDIQSKTNKTDINNKYGNPDTNNDQLGYLIRVCTQGPGPLNPFKKLRKGMPFRIHKDEISSYNFYDFSKEPEKGEVSGKDEDIHFIETFKAAEIPDRLMRVKQLLPLVLDEKPTRSIVSLQRRIYDLEPDLSLADIDAALKELGVMDLIHKSEDGLYMHGKEAAHD